MTDVILTIGGLIWIASMLVGLARRSRPLPPQKFEAKFDFYLTIHPSGKIEVSAHPPAKQSSSYVN